MSGISARVDATRMFARFKALDGKLQRPVIELVNNYSDKAEQMLAELLNKPVTQTRGGGIRRSRPGQAPRRETGKMRDSIKIKQGKSAFVRYVTITADDGKGGRYPFMLQSGTKHIKKRPSVNKIQRKLNKPMSREFTNAIRRAIRSS